MVERYWRTVAKRAFSETLVALGLTSIGAILMRGLAGAAVIVALLYLGSPDAGRDEWVGKLAILAVVVF